MRQSVTAKHSSSKLLVAAGILALATLALPALANAARHKGGDDLQYSCGTVRTFRSALEGLSTHQIKELAAKYGVTLTDHQARQVLACLAQKT